MTPLFADIGNYGLDSSGYQVGWFVSSLVQLIGGHDVPPLRFRARVKAQKVPYTKFLQGAGVYDFFSQQKSKPFLFLTFFCAPWQDDALFKSLQICWLSVIIPF